MTKSKASVSGAPHGGGTAIVFTARSPHLTDATARRLVDIERRNEIRREAGLPLLSIPKELRRMKTQEVSREFERFAAARSKAIWDEVLSRRRGVEGTANRKPNSLEGICYQSQIRRDLWDQFTQRK
jgi:hypothetical protein